MAFFGWCWFFFYFPNKHWELKRNYKKNNCSKITPNPVLVKIYFGNCKASYFLYLVPFYSACGFTMVYTAPATVEQILIRAIRC